MNRTDAFADRPPSARPNTGNVSARANSFNSYNNASRDRTGFGNAHFAGASLTNTSFSGVGSGRFSSARSSNARSSFAGRGIGSSSSAYNGFGRSNFGYGGYGRGYGHRGFGYGRFGYGGLGYGGWYGGGNDLWFLGDLFGLALDFGRFAWSPWAPVGLVGWDLLNSGIQALDDQDNNDQQSYQQPYLNDQQTYPNDQQPYTPLCGTDYSDENPGCQQ